MCVSTLVPHLLTGARLWQTTSSPIAGKEESKYPKVIGEHMLPGANQPTSTHLLGCGLISSDPNQNSHSVKQDTTMALILRKLVQVVKHDESGVHRLSDVVGQGESPCLPGAGCGQGTCLRSASQRQSKQCATHHPTVGQGQRSSYPLPHRGLRWNKVRLCIPSPGCVILPTKVGRCTTKSWMVSGSPTTTPLNSWCRWQRDTRVDIAPSTLSSAT